MNKFDLKKYISNNPLLKEDMGAKTEYTEDEVKYSLGVDDDYEGWAQLAFDKGFEYDEHRDIWTIKEQEEGYKTKTTVSELKTRIKEIIKSTVNEVKTDEYGNHLEPQFQKGDKITYLSHPGVITGVNKTPDGKYTYNVSYDKGEGKTKVPFIFNKGGEIKKA